MPQMLVLVGLPGSGKSVFSNRLTALFKGKNVIIDRCNFDEDQRKIWVKIAEETRCPVDALFFDISVKVCKERVTERKGHPTGVEGKFGAEVVARFDKIMSIPKVQEGFRFIHNILVHLPCAKKPLPVDQVYIESVLVSILALFPPVKSAQPPAPTPAPPKPAPPKQSSEKVEVDVDVKISDKNKGGPVNVKIDVVEDKCPPPPKAAPKPACPPPQPKPKVENNSILDLKKSNDFWSAPWADKKSLSTITKPNEGFGTYKETKAMWEDEHHTQHFNHSLFNEQAEREDSKNKQIEKRTRHLQHSDHMVNAEAGMARAFDHTTLDRDQNGHEILSCGKKQHFHDRSHFHHQHEHQEDAKAGSARTYEHKHMSNIRHIHAGDDKADKARTEAFEHRSFNYAFKGGASFDPEKVMMSSFKNKLKFEDEIKASFHNLPMNDHFKFAQNVQWETELPTRPNFSVFK
ncbi:Transcription factor [Smittium culicis]|uniref:Transcription factor n=1 Tax=Smittium culicis TaxID=133412 RepID=A0A1R1X0L1_9FUNG|nr:Transcription factor [Smittium culicis]